MKQWNTIFRMFIPRFDTIVSLSCYGSVCLRNCTEKNGKFLRHSPPIQNPKSFVVRPFSTRFCVILYVVRERIACFSINDSNYCTVLSFIEKYHVRRVRVRYECVNAREHYKRNPLKRQLERIVSNVKRFQLNAATIFSEKKNHIHIRTRMYAIISFELLDVMACNTAL